MTDEELMASQLGEDTPARDEHPDVSADVKEPTADDETDEDPAEQEQEHHLSVVVTGPMDEIA